MAPTRPVTTLTIVKFPASFYEFRNTKYLCQSKGYDVKFDICRKRVQYRGDEGESDQCQEIIWCCEQLLQLIEISSMTVVG